jgi:glycosyltransferase involved in cell wall biosynthesis
MARVRADPTVAIFVWGDVIEDYLEPIGIDLDTIATEIWSGYLFGYAEALRRAGVRPVIVCSSRQVRHPERLVHTSAAVPLWLLPSPKPFLALRRVLEGGSPWAANPRTRGNLTTAARYLSTSLRGLTHMLRAEGCTALLCQEYEEPRFDLCVALGRILRIPVFATFQGGYEATSVQSIRRWSIRSSSGLIVAPSIEAKRVRDRYGVDGLRIARIPNALDPSQFDEPSRADARHSLGLPIEAKVVAWHGRTDVHNKGLDVLIDAWTRVCAERPGEELHLVMVGGGIHAREVRQQLVATGLDNVHWLDRFATDRTILRTHLRAADVYAFPSRREGFPVAPLEAMACGLPVVAASALGMEEILGEDGDRGGWLVPVGDTGAFATALGQALDDLASTRAAGRIAREQVEARFSLEAVGSALRSFLEAPPGSRNDRGASRRGGQRHPTSQGHSGPPAGLIRRFPGAVRRRLLGLRGLDPHLAALESQFGALDARLASIDELVHAQDRELTDLSSAVESLTRAHQDR